VTLLYSKRAMLDDLYHTLDAVGERLVTRPKEPRVLKLAADRLPALSQVIGNKDLVLLSSYLKLLTDDLWFNVMTDNSGKVSIKQRDSLMKNIGYVLRDLSSSLQEKKIAEIYACYARLGAIWSEVPKLRGESFQRGTPKARDDSITRADKKALINCENVLSSGFKSKWNYDIDTRLCRFRDTEELANQYVCKINALLKMGVRIDKLAFIDKDYGPVGTIALMSSITAGTKLDSLIVRLRRRVPIGQIKCEKTEKDEHLLIVSDVLTTGDGILKAAEILRKTTKVTHALVYLDRDQGGRERLEHAGIVVETIRKPGEIGIEKPKPFPVIGDELFPIDPQ